MFGCSFSNLRLIKEIQRGFFSEFHFICEICHVQEIIRTEPFSNEIVPINLAVVASTLHSGQGYSSIEQFSAGLNMPSMSNPTYQKLHEEVEEKMKCIAWDATEEAAKEEAKLAYENGNVSKDGIPMISVVVDGAWSKRSYRCNYNALSGVVSKLLHNYNVCKNKKYKYPKLFKNLKAHRSYKLKTCKIILLGLYCGV